MIFSLVMILTTPEKNEDPFCKRDAASEILKLVDRSTYPNEISDRLYLDQGKLETPKKEFDELSSQLPISSRHIRYHGIASGINGKTTIYLAVAPVGSDSSEGGKRIELNMGESYYGLYFAGIDKNREPIILGADGKEMKWAGSGGKAMLFDALQPLSGALVAEVISGNEDFLLKDFQKFQATGSSDLGIPDLDTYAHIRGELAFIKSQAKKDFESLLMVGESLPSGIALAHWRSEITEPIRVQIYQTLGYATLDSESQRLYASMEPLPFNACGEYRKYKVPPWLKDSEKALVNGVDHFQFEGLFKRCITENQKEGVCCTIESSGGSQRYECRERRPLPKMDDILENCQQSSFDECGNPNRNLPESRPDGKKCKLSYFEGIGVCSEGACIPPNHYQDQFPCRKAVSKNIAKIADAGADERQKKIAFILDIVDFQASIAASIHFLEQYQVPGSALYTNDPENLAVQRRRFRLAQKDFDKKATDAHRQVTYFDTNRFDLETLHQYLDFAEKMKKQIQEELFSTSVLEKMKSEDLRGSVDENDYDPLKDGAPCGLNKVCRSGECISYNAKDWKTVWDAAQVAAAKKKREIIETLGAFGAKTDASFSDSCVHRNQEDSLEILENGNSCILIPWAKNISSVFGSCWEGQCLICDRKSKTKLLGLPPCPRLRSAPDREGVRLSCEKPEFCVY